MSWLASVLVSLLLFTQIAFAKPLQAGGEIPWPLSNQHVVTVNHGTGLWSLDSYDSSMYFNVEIQTNEKGYDWIRVAELNKETFEVISWGEGFFSNELKEVASGYTNFSVNPQKDAYGRYLHMFPKGDLKKNPYVLRLVEVETPIGFLLGLSIIHVVEGDYEHFLGQRVLKNPLKCKEGKVDTDNLTCEIK